MAAIQSLLCYLHFSLPFPDYQDQDQEPHIINLRLLFPPPGRVRLNILLFNAVALPNLPNRQTNKQAKKLC